MEVADRLGLQEVLDRRQETLRDQDLAGLSLATEAGGQVRHRSDGAVVPAPFEADGADRRVALGDADAEVELVAVLPPLDAQLSDPVAHLQRHPDRPLGRVRHRHGVVEEDHHAITGEALERSVVGEDQLAHLGVVLP